jgi:SHS2 domain-containing protein
MGTVEYLEHTADVGMRVSADSFEALLESAARGMARLTIPSVDSIEPVGQRAFEFAGDDPALILFDLLNELLFVFATERLITLDLQLIQLDSAPTDYDSETQSPPSVDKRSSSEPPRRVRATVSFGRFDPDRDAAGPEVKAVTYHELAVTRDGRQWRAQVIFDI